MRYSKFCHFFKRKRVGSPTHSVVPTEHFPNAHNANLTNYISTHILWFNPPLVSERGKTRALGSGSKISPDFFRFFFTGLKVSKCNGINDVVMIEANLDANLTIDDPKSDEAFNPTTQGCAIERLIDQLFGGFGGCVGGL